MRNKYLRVERLDWRVRKAPAMVVHRLLSPRGPSASAGSLWSGKRQIVRKRDQTGVFHGLRQTKDGGRPSQVLCGPAEPIAAEIHQPWAPRQPRILAMVQGVTRHFEQNQCKRRTTCHATARLPRAPSALFTPLTYPSLV